MAKPNAKRKLMTVSLPPEMLAHVETLRRLEQRSRSELVREALRVYFAQVGHFPEVTAAPAEIRALKQAREDYLSGNTITLDEYEHTHVVDGSPQPKRRKAARSATATRQRGGP